MHCYKTKAILLMTEIYKMKNNVNPPNSLSDARHTGPASDFRCVLELMMILEFSWDATVARGLTGQHPVRLAADDVFETKPSNYGHYVWKKKKTQATNREKTVRMGLETLNCKYHLISNIKYYEFL